MLFAGTPLSPMQPVPASHPAAPTSEAAADSAAAAPAANPDAAAAADEPQAAAAGEPETNGALSGASTPRLQLPGSVTIPSAAQPLIPAAAGAPGGQPAASTPQSARTQALDPVLQKDAFLVFRALCKLSIKTADASSGTDLTATRGKVLPCS
jgi:brefeldin A-inhibited guanine nucleotide-exchange protein